ncbi:MAG: hypothetical protein RL308_285 [Bacteroidota bacterium]|jgi:hypothetical protein
MTQTIIAIIRKANTEGCLEGGYESHLENPFLLSAVNVKLTTGQIVIISKELIQDFSNNTNILVCGKIKIN